MDKNPKYCYILSSVGPTPDGILEVPVFEIVTVILFALALLAMLVAPFVSDDPEAGIKTSEGQAGPEYDHCRPEVAPIQDATFNGNSIATASV